MKKIEFVNGQAPYLNEQNLNQLQDNMEEVSVPEGGTSGQVLVKASNTDNDVEWSNPTVTTVVDELTNDSSTSALSAKQGKVLNEGKVNNSDFAVVTGVVETYPHGTPLSEQIGLVTVDCPSGFNGDNSVIISCGYEASPYGPSEIPYNVYNCFNFGPFGPSGWGLNCILGIPISVSAYYNSALTEAGEPYYVYFRLVLMKIS